MIQPSNMAFIPPNYAMEFADSFPLNQTEYSSLSPLLGQEFLIHQHQHQQQQSYLKMSLLQQQQQQYQSQMLYTQQQNAHQRHFSLPQQQQQSLQMSEDTLTLQAATAAAIVYSSMGLQELLPYQILASSIMGGLAGQQDSQLNSDASDINGWLALLQTLETTPFSQQMLTASGSTQISQPTENQLQPKSESHLQENTLLITPHEEFAFSSTQHSLYSQDAAQFQRPFHPQGFIPCPSFSHRGFEPSQGQKTIMGFKQCGDKLRSKQLDPRQGQHEIGVQALNSKKVFQIKQFRRTEHQLTSQNGEIGEDSLCAVTKSIQKNKKMVKRNCPRNKSSTRQFKRNVNSQELIRLKKAQNSAIIFEEKEVLQEETEIRNDQPIEKNKENSVVDTDNLMDSLLVIFTRAMEETQQANENKIQKHSSHHEDDTADAQYPSQQHKSMLASPSPSTITPSSRSPNVSKPSYIRASKTKQIPKKQELETKTFTLNKLMACKKRILRSISKDSTAHSESSEEDCEKQYSNASPKGKIIRQRSRHHQTDSKKNSDYGQDQLIPLVLKTRGQQNKLKETDSSQNESYCNLDLFSEATQILMNQFERYYLRTIPCKAEQSQQFREFMKIARKNDEYISLLLNPIACRYSHNFLNFLRGPALVWIRKNVDPKKQQVYFQLTQMFKSEDRGLSSLRPRKNRNQLGTNTHIV